MEAVEQPKYSGEGHWQGYPGWIAKSAVKQVKSVPLADLVIDKRESRVYHDPDPRSPFVPLSMGSRVTGTDVVRNRFRKVKTVSGNTGWIHEDDLRPSKSFLSEEISRKIIVHSAEQFLGDPYFWGGRSVYLPELKGRITSVDCSGLVSLAYRVAGIEVPRDSKDQYLKSRKIKSWELGIGDLIFSASKSKPGGITHVAIYLGENTVIEAPKTGESVRKIGFEGKYGIPLDQVRTGEDGSAPAGDRLLYFGTYFENKKN